jgi:hypothetical protein
MVGRMDRQLGVTRRTTPHERSNKSETVPQPPAREQILALQQSAGNRAVNRNLATSALIARQATTPQPGPIPQATGAADDFRIVDPIGRDRLEKEAHSRINQAFGAFQMAVLAHQASLNAEAKAEAEMVAAVVDILTGFAAPAFAGFVGAKLAERAAEKMTQQVTKEKVAQLISTSDKLKASFGGATKVATTAIKLNSTALFGETDADQFAKSVRKTFHAGAQSLTDSIGGMTDDQLLAVWVAYDYDFTNEDVYRDALQTLFAQFKSYVRPLGHEDISQKGIEAYGESILEDRKAVYMDAYGAIRLAIVKITTVKGIFTDSAEMTFESWVPDRIAPWVVEKSTHKYGKVETIDPVKITGHIPAP